MKACGGKRHNRKDQNLSLSVFFFSCQFHPNGGSALTLASLLETGLTGNWTSVAFSIVFSCRMSCCDWLWPKGWRRRKRKRESFRNGPIKQISYIKSKFLPKLTFLPYRHWKKIMPTDQTSTLLEIFGGSLPTTKHSGGRYLAG